MYIKRFQYLQEGRICDIILFYEEDNQCLLRKVYYSDLAVLNHKYKCEKWSSMYLRKSYYLKVIIYM